MYIDNLADEVKHEKAKVILVNKKSLTVAVIKKIPENKDTKQKIIELFEKKPTTVNHNFIKQFLNNVGALIHNSPTEKEQITDKEESLTIADFPVRTYVIAKHIHLEISNNELHYETLIRDTTALKEFISTKFKANKISGRFADMKSLSYKKIISGKNNEGAKGQLKPQLKQIAFTPLVFGNDVSAFAKNILKNYYDFKT